MEPNGSTWSQKGYQKETKSVENGTQNVQYGEWMEPNVPKVRLETIEKTKKQEIQKRSARGRQQPFELLGPDYLFFETYGEQNVDFVNLGTKIDAQTHQKSMSKTKMEPNVSTWSPKRY